MYRMINGRKNNFIIVPTTKFILLNLPLAFKFDVIMEPLITKSMPLTSLTQIGIEMSFSPMA